MLLKRFAKLRVLYRSSDSLKFTTATKINYSTSTIISKKMQAVKSMKDLGYAFNCGEFGNLYNYSVIIL